MGNIVYKLGGSIKFLNKEEQVKTSWGRMGNVMEYTVVGGFDLRINGKIKDFYLLELSDFDRSYYSHLKLNSNEKIYRYQTYVTKIGNMLPLVKVNINKGLIYFMSDSSDEKKPTFETKGIRPMWISLSESEKHNDKASWIHNYNDSNNKFDNGGLTINENWGNDGSTASNNEDYNNLYALFPDNHKEAKHIWNQLSEKQKEGFLYDLDVTDAASEHIKDSWLEFVNAESENDWLDNATNWDEMKNGGGVGVYTEARKWWGNDLSLNQQKEYAKKHLQSFEYSELLGTTSQYSTGERMEEFITNIWEGEGSPKSSLKGLYNDGGTTEDKTRIASEILKQLGGANRLNAMIGAYNFIALPNGISFRIKNAKANYIKVVLTSMDLYDLEVGRIRGGDYKVVVKKGGLYNDMLKSSIEQATGMYLSLEDGGLLENITKQKEKISNELAYLKERKYDLENNKVRPNKIIGTGFKPQYARRLAFEWLNEQISKEESKLVKKNEQLKDLSEGKNIVLYKINGKDVIDEMIVGDYVMVHYADGMHEHFTPETLSTLRVLSNKDSVEEKAKLIQDSIDSIREAIRYIKDGAISGDQDSKQALSYLYGELKDLGIDENNEIESFADLYNPQNINGFIYKSTGDMIKPNIYQDFQVVYYNIGSEYDFKKDSVNNPLVSEIQLWESVNGKMKMIKKWKEGVIGSVFSGDSEIENSGIYKEGSEVLIGGKADYLSLDDIAEMHNVSINHILRQVNIGKSVEREHTSDVNKIIEIVKDHLYENPNYYTLLQKIESSFSDGGGVSGYWINVPANLKDRFYSLASTLGYTQSALENVRYSMLKQDSVNPENDFYRYEFSNEMDLDKAIVILNKIQNPDYKNDMPKNLNQLKNYLTVGKLLRVSYNRNRPDAVSKIKVVARVQTNGLYFSDGVVVPEDAKTNMKGLSWIEYPKTDMISFSPFGFTIYAQDKINNKPPYKFLQYEYIDGEQEVIAKNSEKSNTVIYNESVKMLDFISNVNNSSEAIKFYGGGQMKPDMIDNRFELDYENKTVSCFINSLSTGRTLILRRSEGDNLGSWSLISGTVELNESPDETIKREIQEELGVNLNYDSLIFISLTKHLDKTHFYYELTVNDEFTPILNPENDEYSWINMGEFPSNTHPLLKKYIKNNVFA